MSVDQITDHPKSAPSNQMSPSLAIYEWNPQTPRPLRNLTHCPTVNLDSIFLSYSSYHFPLNAFLTTLQSVKILISFLNTRPRTWKHRAPDPNPNHKTLTTVLTSIHDPLCFKIHWPRTTHSQKHFVFLCPSPASAEPHGMSSPRSHYFAFCCSQT